MGRYMKIYEMVEKKFKEIKIKFQWLEEKEFKRRGLDFDFNKNPHLQDTKNIDEVFRNFIWHSQNKSKNYAFDLNYRSNGNDEALLNEILDRVVLCFDYESKNYLELASKVLADEGVKDVLEKSKNDKAYSGREISFVGFAKTCFCIHDYLFVGDKGEFLNKDDAFERFKSNHIFTDDFKTNWDIISNADKRIFGMSTALIPDFFKEQKYIKGRQFLIKPDVHVKRFVKILLGSTKEPSDKQVYDEIMRLYTIDTDKEKFNYPPYNLDKMIYLIGVNCTAKESEEYIKIIKSSI